MGESFLIDFSYMTLRLAARLAGVSIRELAEAALERDNARRAAGRAQQLERIAGRLQSYRGENRERDIADFAHAEAYEEDPVQAHRIFPADAHGVGAAFGARMERR
jgi:hypothetical protein